MADLTAGQDDVALAWIGFLIGDLPADDPASRLGYGACVVSGETTALAEIMADGDPDRGAPDACG